MILYVNACVRSTSRTHRLALALLNKLGGEVRELRLNSEELPNLADEAVLEARTQACRAGNKDDALLKYAVEFAAADTIVISAPLWDLNFPAVLKRYIEAICCTGVTFCYSEQGIPVGLCRAKKLYYVTTCGGTLFDDSFGYGYIRTLAQGMFGIKETELIKAENLDIIGNDAEKLLAEAIEKLAVNE